MTIAILDIVDASLQLWDGEQLLESPGYALLDGQRYRFGLEARGAARLRPRDINNRYWWQLNTDVLQPELGPARHTADLVHAHLLDIYQQAGKPKELIIAAPSGMQREQLALLLGIIKQCPFDAVGLVSRSVALASLFGTSDRFFHLEIQLQQAVVSELINRDGVVNLHKVFPLPGNGLLHLQERLTGIIGSAFIRQTRFGPRRTAESEQRLYDHLPDVLLALEEHGEYDLDMAGYRARIGRKDLAVAAEPLLKGIHGAIGKTGPGDRYLLDPIAGSLPGFAELFSTAHRLENNDLSGAVSQHQDSLVQREQSLNFVTSLPRLATGTNNADTVVHEVSPPRPDTPSHLLQGGHARPLRADGTMLDGQCELHFLGGSWQLQSDRPHSMHVNGVAYTPGQALYCGDSISSADGTRALLILVED